MVIVAVGIVLALLLGDGLLTLKYVLFLIGFLLFGLGSFGIQPKRPMRKKKRITVETDTAHDFEERLLALPGMDRFWIPHSDRISRDVKVFLTSLVVLGVSLFIEFGLDVSG